MEHPVPVLVLHPHREAVPGDAGIVDEDVERAQRRLGLARQGLDLGTFSEVAGQHGAVPAELGRERVERLAAGAGDRHAGALRPERAGDGAAQAARGAGDEGGRALKVEHGELPQGLQAASMNLATSSGVPTPITEASGAMRLTKPDRTLPDPTSTKRVDAGLGHPCDRLAPANRAADLADEAAGDLARRVDGARQDVRDEGQRGIGQPRGVERLRHGVGGGPHQGAVERGRDGQEDGAPDAPPLGDGDRALAPRQRSPKATTWPPPLSLATWQTSPSRRLGCDGEAARARARRRAAPPWRTLRRPGRHPASPSPRIGAATGRHPLTVRGPRPPPRPNTRPGNGRPR